MALTIFLGVLACLLVIELVLIAFCQPKLPWYIVRDTWHYIRTGEIKEHTWVHKDTK